MRQVCVLLGVGLTLLTAESGVRASLATAARSPQGPVAAPAAADLTSRRALLDTYCVTCHNERTKVGGLELDKIDLARHRRKAPKPGRRSCGSSAAA